MKVTGKRKPTGTAAKVVLALITDPVFLQFATRNHRPGLYHNKVHEQVAAELVRYWAKYEACPGEDVHDLFAGDEAAEKVLKQAAKSDALSTHLIMDQAVTYWNHQILNRREELRNPNMDSEGLLEIDLAHPYISNEEHHQEEDVFDPAVLERMDEGELLVDYGDTAVGAFLNPHMRRKKFVSFLAPEKCGKTYFLMDVAWTAAKQSRNVLFLSAGDMSLEELAERWIPRAGSCVAKFQHGIELNRNGEWAYRTPTKIDFGYGRGEERGGFCIELEEVAGKYMKPMGKRAVKKAMRACRKAFKGKLRQQFFPAGTLTLDRIETILSRTERQGWKVDVLVIDYADLLAAPRKEGREAIDYIWKRLRALCHKFNLLLVSATQSDAQAYDGRGFLSARNFSEDKRKNAHVTAMIGINMPAQCSVDNMPQEQPTARVLNVILARGHRSPPVVVAGNFDITQPVLLSRSIKPKKV